jgi:uncharacterized metal-binding protein YceD (DUF177 family)
LEELETCSRCGAKVFQTYYQDLCEECYDEVYGENGEEDDTK